MQLQHFEVWLLATLFEGTLYQNLAWYKQFVQNCLQLKKTLEILNELSGPEAESITKKTRKKSRPSVPLTLSPTGVKRRQKQWHRA